MAVFPTTRWSLIQARDRTQAEVGAAWSDLVRAYQPAILGYFRRSVLSRDADDLAQEFMLRSMSEGWWSRANPEVGSFRTFLLTLLNRFLAQHKDSGYRRFELVGADAAEARDYQTPEHYFDLQFALCLTRVALAELQKDYESDGRGELFSALQPWLVEPPERGELVALGARMQIPPNTLAVQLKRLRTRLQKAVHVALGELNINKDHTAADMDALRRSLVRQGAA
ncbi:MAG TPA: sigma factor [Xanthomonadaceae bacterium]|jgi:RNA polymerase sigma-70 factor (ECF subfamily)